MRREYSQFYSSTSRKDIFVENRALAGGPPHGHRHCHSVFRSWSFARPVALLEFLPRATRAWVVAADFGAGADDLLYRGRFGAATGHFRLLEFTLFLALELVLDFVYGRRNVARPLAVGGREGRTLLRRC